MQFGYSTTCTWVKMFIESDIMSEFNIIYAMHATNFEKAHFSIMVNLDEKKSCFRRLCDFKIGRNIQQIVHLIMTHNTFLVRSV